MSFSHDPRFLTVLSAVLLSLAAAAPVDAASNSLEVRQMVYTGATPTAPQSPPVASRVMTGNGPIAGSLDAALLPEEIKGSQGRTDDVLSQLVELLQSILRQLVRTAPPPQSAQSATQPSRIPTTRHQTEKSTGDGGPSDAPPVAHPTSADTPVPPTTAVARPPVSPPFDQRVVNARTPRVVAYPFVPVSMRIPIAAPLIAFFFSNGGETPLIDATSIALTGIALAALLRLAWALVSKRRGSRGSGNVR